MQRTGAGLSAEGRCSLGAYSGGLEAKVWTRWPNFSFPDNSLHLFFASKKQVGFGLFFCFLFFLGGFFFQLT